MINILPEIYKNELFYSIIARYRRMCGMVSKRALMRDIFGEVNTITSSYFPQYIDRFVNNLPPTSKITVQEIINNHTMFPFYTAFLPKAKTEMIYKIMEKGGTNHELISNN
ncbi:TniQ family protein [Paracerasibacillus soli]|uniref:TniQ family protein n=1 Tax=Paracerasibacillus soli TaxID=480284 RepID=A0ABU5CM14_9BACI|nr:TniQ family protein [Virgibacillus soli]MDY0407407.1 TniQ family protein [Virgibacillus soli]